MVVEITAPKNVAVQSYLYLKCDPFWDIKIFLLEKIYRGPRLLNCFLFDGTCSKLARAKVTEN